MTTKPARILLDSLVTALALGFAVPLPAAEIPDVSRRPVTPERLGGGGSLPAEADEFKVKREAVFEFTQKPKVTREGDKITIAFETKAFCDVTVAIENTEGSAAGPSANSGQAPKIVRHLASGVLGPNAPLPFQKNSLKQAVVWDGKDDQGAYVDDKDRCAVRVSLGLKPQLERTLYWSPFRRSGWGAPLVVATKEGVYVYDGLGVDHLRLFGHDGEYRRTIYPFPADKIEQVQGVERREFPQGGRWPVKRSALMQTFLTSGDNGENGPEGIHAAMAGSAATALAVSNGRIALAKRRLNRLATDGSTGGLPLEGPKVTEYVALNPNYYYGPPKEEICPWSAAISPDGKWVYFAGYAHRIGDARGTGDFGCLHGVTRMKYTENGERQVFAGKMTAVSERHNNMADAGTENGRFACATSVACDAKGRVYVSDYLNDRIQIFAEDGAWLKNIATEKPAKIQIHPETGEIYVFSWVVHNAKTTPEFIKDFKHTLTRFGPFDDPKKIETYPLPLAPYNYYVEGASRVRQSAPHATELDCWADPPTLWLATAKESHGGDWPGYNIRTFVLKDGKFVPKSAAGDTVARALGRKAFPNAFPQIQYLYVNPVTGKLYLGEPCGGGTGQEFDQLVEIDPLSGAVKLIDLPFLAIDAAFDLNGCIYLRSVDVVVRYDPKSWREIPWDYGETFPAVGAWGDRKTAPVISGLVIPSQRTNQGHQGGMCVSPKGYLAVSCVNNEQPLTRGQKDSPLASKKYTPPIYPGRMVRECVHVFDPHGKTVYEDAVPGLGRTDSVWMDASDDLYVMTVVHRVLDGKPYFNNKTGTLVKFKPRTARVESSSQRQEYVPVPLPGDAQKKRLPDLYGLGNIWAEGAQWFYGGVGFSGKNLGGDAEMGCCCWHSTFTLDLFARSFASEVDQYRVAVLDRSGNLIMRVGRYGNVDDGIPMRNAESGVRKEEDSSRSASVPSSASRVPRSIGGDEVGLFHACYLATHSDRRLFVADIGNGCIRSVKLGYHAEDSIPLKNIPDSAKKAE